MLKEERATGLVNAVLRRFVSERAALFARVDTQLAGRTAHPPWLVKRLSDAWPSQICEDILEANNAHPPMVLRLDLSRQERQQYLAELAAAGIVAKPVDWTQTAVRLEEPVAVSALPGFHEGRVSVQDAGAQLAAPLLAAQPGMRVLDACAAPGGKTGHLLEHTADLAELVAVDIDAQRVGRIEENLRRLNRSARLVVADIRQPASFWDGKPFDRILVDAPCSSTGRDSPASGHQAATADGRHPGPCSGPARDSPGGFWNVGRGRTAALFHLFRASGREPEGRRAISRDRARPRAPSPCLPGSRLRPGPWSGAQGLQLLPGSQAGTDGFYYACVEKTTVGT